MVFYGIETLKQNKMSTEKDLNYWKANAEEDYKQVPISVLSYIMEVTDRCFGTFGVPRKTLRYEFKKAIDKMICCS